MQEDETLPKLRTRSREYAKQTEVKSHMPWYIATERPSFEILVRDYHFDKISVVLNFPSNL